jgi:hypothetical protein
MLVAQVIHAKKEEKQGESKSGHSSRGKHTNPFQETRIFQFSVGNVECRGHAKAAKAAKAVKAAKAEAISEVEA